MLPFDKLLIRFADTDTQLKARDVIKVTLGDDDYTVALNIASRTPRWLTALGAYPMKLGLDLRGGVRFLLEVDANALLKAREDGEGTDFHALRHGQVSITPLQVDMTDHQRLPDICGSRTRKLRGFR